MVNQGKGSGKKNEKNRGFDSYAWMAVNQAQHKGPKDVKW